VFLLFGAFIAGILTVLAPCVLPLLPIIIGGSVSGDTKDRRRPVIIAVSLAISLILFTLLLKATTLLINVPPQAITYFSGGIIVALGIATLFPQLYTTIMARIGLEHRAQKLLGTGNKNRSQVVGPIIIGAALGPVFSSCSPVYGYILATVLPAHFARAFAYIVSYVVGLALVLLAVGYYGQRFSAKLSWASKPDGIFQRSLAGIFIVVGILIITGTGTKIQTFAANHSFLNFDSVSAKLLPKSDKTLDDSKLYNVSPYNAPELVGLQNWINSQPQTLAKLKGKVVLIDFWTYSCINCIRTLPYVEGWYQQYQKDGLVVLGISAPEFAFEKVPANVAKAVKDDKLTYPIALDNDLQTWGAFHNQYWPAEYLINRDGKVVRQHFGEGEYDQTEKAIRGLLKEGTSAKNTQLSSKLVASSSAPDPVANGQTPETYLGGERANAYEGTPALTASVQTYHFSDNLDNNAWSLSGKWQVDGDQITAKGGSKIRLNFAAKNIYLVGGSARAADIGVSIDGKPITSPGVDVVGNKLHVNGDRLYTVVSFSSFTSGILEFSVPNDVHLNTFTFGN
jgi:cytochrome c biogenesis protein CcdA/thiol-disulfide isomerase/thioredoxin